MSIKVIRIEKSGRYPKLVPGFGIYSNPATPSNKKIKLVNSKVYTSFEGDVRSDASKVYTTDEVYNKNEVNRLIAQLESKIKNLESLSTQRSPIGEIIAFGGKVTKRNTPPNNLRLDPNYSGIPEGWLLCDGRELSENAPFNKLYQKLKDSWGQSGEETFRIPDLRGRFLRGVTRGSGRDPDKGNRYNLNQDGEIRRSSGVGSYQDDAYQHHSHNIRGGQSFDADIGNGGQVHGRGQLRGEFSGVISGSGESKETRPKNAYVNWLIRF